MPKVAFQTANPDFPEPNDVALGERIRARRRDLSWSQEQLARMVGITFQQIQKYEHGTNRVSFSRLVEIAHAMNCSAHDLIGDIDRPASERDIFADRQRLLNLPGAVDLLADYARLAPQQRRAVCQMAHTLAGTDAKADSA